MAAVWISADTVLEHQEDDDRDRAGIATLAAAVAALGTPDWYADALCQEYPGDWWFPTKGNNTTSAARSVCNRCLVADECATYADEQGTDLIGVWAGEPTRTRQARLRAERMLRVAV